MMAKVVSIDQEGIREVKRLHMRNESQSLYTALEELNFHWCEKDVIQFDHMWEEGLSIWDIATAFKRDPDEVAILAMDRAKNGYIRKRNGGAFGRRKRAKK